eukprot:CAMPEP_0177655638 /NCGR_PEP_ID=MMETSP0447-20121125/15090_1 /TAXON_ID=0 /ORGANISM="Stygamoeba regulata, Strain BSH-02190019" /LENGTH=228 /DNA_ID=CAMNT_0019159603 /DNA_START=107 /DNA_END=790 /DNA_ORIENTATION=-
MSAESQTGKEDFPPTGSGVYDYSGPAPVELNLDVTDLREWASKPTPGGWRERWGPHLIHPIPVLPPKVEGAPVRLSSTDGREFEVSRQVAYMSETVKNLVEDVGDEMDSAIPLASVHSLDLEEVIKYCQYHEKHPEINAVKQPRKWGKWDIPIDQQYANTICAWDQQFIDQLGVKRIFDVMLAANYLDVKPLLRLLCKAVANQMKGKSPQEIRAYFGIEKDFTGDLLK